MAKFIYNGLGKEAKEKRAEVYEKTYRSGIKNNSYDGSSVEGFKEKKRGDERKERDAEFKKKIAQLDASREVRGVLFVKGEPVEVAENDPLFIKMMTLCRLDKKGNPLPTCNAWIGSAEFSLVSEGDDQKNQKKGK